MSPFLEKITFGLTWVLAGDSVACLRFLAPTFKPVVFPLIFRFLLYSLYNIPILFGLVFLKFLKFKWNFSAHILIYKKDLLFENNVYLTRSRIFIPPNATQLKLRILVISHCRLAGRRAIQATLNGIQKRFYWTAMSEDVSSFVSNVCIVLLIRVELLFPVLWVLLFMLMFEILFFILITFRLLYLGKSNLNICLSFETICRLC